MASQGGFTSYDQRMEADIARLRAAKGIQPRAWLAANRGLALVFLGYLALIGVYAAIAYARGEPVGGGVLVGVFFGPLVLLRVVLRWRRRP
jgi:hypothetical protein